MNCKECREKFSDPQEISGIERDPDVAAHLSACEPCRKHLADAKSLTAGFSSLAEKPAPIELSERILKIPESFASRKRTAPFWHTLRFQMGFSFAVAASILVFLILNPPSDDLVPLKEATRFKKAVEKIAPGGGLPSAFPKQDLLDQTEMAAEAKTQPETPQSVQAAGPVVAPQPGAYDAISPKMESDVNTPHQRKPPASVLGTPPLGKPPASVLGTPAPFQVAAGPKEITSEEKKPVYSKIVTANGSEENMRGRAEKAKTSESSKIALPSAEGRSGKPQLVVGEPLDSGPEPQEGAAEGKRSSKDAKISGDDRPPSVGRAQMGGPPSVGRAQMGGPIRKKCASGFRRTNPRIPSGR